MDDMLNMLYLIAEQNLDYFLYTVSDIIVKCFNSPGFFSNFKVPLFDIQIILFSNNAEFLNIG